MTDITNTDTLATWDMQAAMGSIRRTRQQIHHHQHDIADALDWCADQLAEGVADDLAIPREVVAEVLLYAGCAFAGLMSSVDDRLPPQHLINILGWTADDLLRRSGR